MNFLANGGFSQFTEAIKEYWQIFLIIAIFLVLCAVLLILAVVFRRFKTAFFLLIVGALITAGGCITCIVLVALKWDLPKIVDFVVKFVPTFLFVAIVLWTTFWGSLRGLRKSLILLAQEIGVAVICIILYATLINLSAVDNFLLKVVNFFMGADGLQNMLGVSTEIDSLKQVFVEWLPKFIQDINGDFGLMLSESKAYIYTLADLIYHVTFAILLYFVYIILYWIMYGIYWIFYPERRYKRKIAKKYAFNKVDRRYHRHPVGGGIVGVVRGVTVSMLALSFLGSALFVVAGRGDGKLDDYDFGDDNKNYYYSVYRSIESYGTHGIFKVLNAVSSAEQMPYYLFAADLVFSGELDDKELGVSDNIVFREELSAYTGFARDTMSLLMKYGGDEIRPIINGEADDKALDIILEVMQKEDFRGEFNALIGDFNAQTYIINFAMSFVNSAIAHLDEMTFADSVSPDNRELLKILFTKGYLSDTIPDEKLLKEGEADKETQETLKNRPYINISKLVEKSDVQTVFALVLDVLGEETSTTADTLNLVGKILPEIKKLSVLSQNRAEELDPVLGRLYCYAANRFLTEEGSEGVTYTSVYKEKIEWVSEINALIDTAESAINLFNNVYSDGKEPLDIFVSIFDEDDENYADNAQYYDTVCDNLIKSRVLGKALSTSYFCNLIRKEGIYVSENINFDTTFDADGKLITAGETYNLLNAVRMVGRNSDLLTVLRDFNKDTDTEKLLNSLAEAFVIEDKNNGGATLATYISSSELLRSAVTAVMLNLGGDYVYVPKAALESDADGNKVNLITKSEISALMDNFGDLVNFVSPVINGGDDADMKDTIAEFVSSETFDALIENSAIFEGTVAKLLTDMLKDDGTVVIPAALKEDYESWVTQKTRKGELQKLLRALEIVNIDIGGVIKGELDTDKILDEVLALDASSLDEALNSQVLHYTISNFLIGDSLDLGGFKIIVPISARHELENDSISALVTKAELQYILKFVEGLNLNEELQISDMLVRLVEKKGLIKESKILGATIVNLLVTGEDIKDMLEIPETLSAAATEQELKTFYSSNPWREETVRLINALDEVLEISTTEDFVFDANALEDKISGMLKGLNDLSATAAEKQLTKLDVLYASEVIRNNVTVSLDKALDGNIDEKLLYGAKSSDGYYTYRELQALANVMTLFDIDLNENTDNLADKIQEEIFTLNDEAEGYEGKTRLNVVYPSVIFSGILSKELNNVLLGTGGETPSDPMIDEDVLYAIKGGATRYPEQEISDLITSVLLFGKTDINEIGGLGFEDVKAHLDDLDEICASRLLRGVLTYQLSTGNSLDIDHPNAYEDDIKILKTQEIDSIVRLVDAVGEDNLEDVTFGEVPIKTIREQIFFDSGEVKSYLLLSAVSKNLTDTEAILVDKELVRGYGCIAADEVFAFINAFIALEGDGAKIDTWNSDSGELDYPSETARQVIFESAIARAKLTEQLINRNNGANYVGSKNISEFTDYRTGKAGHYVLSQTELTALFNALDIVNKGESFTIPALTVSDLVNIYNRGENDGRDYISELFASDVLRFKMSDSIIRLKPTIETTPERAMNLMTLKIEDKGALTLAQVKEFIENYS